MSLERRTPLPRGEGPKRSPMPPRNPENPLKRGGNLSRSPFQQAGAPKVRATRRDTGASQAVRDAVFNRDRWCVRCGKALLKGRGDYSIHHLTLRSHGVDNRVEAQALFCGSGTTGCHGWVHAHPAAARAAGWIRLGNARPGSAPQPVMVAVPGGYAWFTLLADGTRHGTEAPEGTAAA